MASTPGKSQATGSKTSARGTSTQPSSPSRTRIAVPQIGNQTRSPSQSIKTDPIAISNALAIRPGPGQVGTRIKVHTNHFKLTWNKADKIYQYSVKIEPRYMNKVGKGPDGEIKTQEVAITPKKTRRILCQLLDKYPTDFKRAATDYTQMLVSLDHLDSRKLSEGWIVEYYEVDEVGPTVGGPKRAFMVKFTSGKTLDPSMYHQQPTNANATAISEDREAILNAFNLMVSRYPSQDPGKTVIGGSRHFAREPRESSSRDLKQGLQALARYERSVRESCDGLLLQINRAVSAFYVDFENFYTLDYLMHGWTGKNVSQLREAEETQNQKLESLAKFIKGLRVTATYGKKLPYTVFSLAESSHPNQRRPMADNVRFLKKFPKAKGGKASSEKQSGKKNIPNKREEEFEKRWVSVKEHLLSMEPKVDLTYPTGLVVNVGSRSNPVCIPAEKLRFQPGIPFRRPLNQSQTKEMVAFASIRPKIGKTMIANDGLEMFGISAAENNPLASRFQLTAKTSMLTINARILARPSLLYSKPLTLPHNKGSWMLKDYEFRKVAQSPFWTLVEFSEEPNPWCNGSDFQTFHGALTAVLERYCYAKQAEVTLQTQRYRFGRRCPAQQEMENMLQNVQAENKKRKPEKKISIIFVILPSNDAGHYETLKRLAETKYGLHTICTVVQHQGLKSKPEFFTNLMLKCNLKMGGSNGALSVETPTDNDIKSLLIDKRTMIVGADVTHAGVGSQIGSPSIAAVVASRDSDYQQYPAVLRCQPYRTEPIEHLEEMMVQHLVKFSEKNKGNLPQQVIFYRDGVSEGEFKMVRTEEHARIVKAFAKVYGDRGQSHPRLLLLCVVKRSNARFYPCGELKSEQEKRHGNQAMDANGNSWPGLVIDSNVTSTNYYDFYLQSHKSIQGTAKPAHYVVLLDEIGVTPDTLQKLTYWQCYTFGRSLQAIAVHPAARLADRACARGRAYLRKYLVDEGEVSGGTNLTEEEKKQQVYSRAVQEFGKGVHDDLAESMFYI